MSTSIASKITTPDISVILPVYNCAAYLKEAINSVLQQTFSNFELIVINDGSTDDTEAIVHSFDDDRIVYVKNDTNKGLIYTLNKGISLAKGKYIARMDGDDVCLPERLEKQFTVFVNYPETKVLATTVSLINEKNEPIGHWKEDIKCITTEAIFRFLPVNNCIAHPTVMMDAQLLRKYMYNPAQTLSEDYDLWLRLSSDNIKINKLNEPLVRHRILKNSFTRSANRNAFLKIMKIKIRFAVQQFLTGKINYFTVKIFLFAFADLAKGIGWRLKKILGV